MRLCLGIAIALCMATTVAAVAQADQETLALVKDGKSRYVIVVPVDTSAEVALAARELQGYLQQISGATLPIVSDHRAVARREIILGNSRHLMDIHAGVSFRKLGDEGFVIRTVGAHLVIAGGPARGTLFGVYTFLEERLGCRWYTAAVSAVPHTSDIVIGGINDTQVPATVYRNVYYNEVWDPMFSARLKLNSANISGLVDDTQRGVGSGNGWAHTIFSYLPPDKYFESHPEYFALRDGKRQPTEPCLSNPDVFRIVVENLRTAMAVNPKARYWSVSQMDNGEPCMCDQCKALDDREGSPAGSVLTFVNKVAAEFPDKIISTLAYWYTMCPPKTVRPAKNVHIMMCYDWNPREPYHGYFLGWSKIAPRMYVWHYVIPCHNIIAPWPNLLLLQSQFKEAIAQGATGTFVEGSYEPGSEFAELRAYLLAKILWGPSCDIDAIMNDFLNGYYGAAGPVIRKYIDAMHESLTTTGDALDGHDWCAQHAGTFLAPAMLAEYDAIFDEAEKAVADDRELLLRVQHARMPLMHAELQLGYGDVDTRIALAERLLHIAKRTQTPFFWDFGNRPTDQYMAEVMDALQKEKAGKQ
jgi:hypothetical protein